LFKSGRISLSDIFAESFSFCFWYSITVNHYSRKFDRSILLVLLVFLLINLYFRLKEIFLNPKFVGSVYGDLENPTNELQKTLDWDYIVLNISRISNNIFTVPVTNQLGKTLSK